MKQIELELQKRLLIVEVPSEIFYNKTKEFIYNYISEQTKMFLLPICLGSELTEEIAKGLVEKLNFPWLAFNNYKNNFETYSIALESFISAIEAQGYYWKINPMLKAGGHSYADLRCPIKYEHKFNQSESKTFNPEKTLIFEIL